MTCLLTNISMPPLFPFCCLFPTPHHPALFLDYLLPHTFYLLPPTFFLLPSPCYLLPSPCYLLPTTFYLLLLPPTSHPQHLIELLRAYDDDLLVLAMDALLALALPPPR
jgi:hypothetical protein